MQDYCECQWFFRTSTVCWNSVRRFNHSTHSIKLQKTLSVDVSDSNLGFEHANLIAAIGPCLLCRMRKSSCGRCTVNDNHQSILIFYDLPLLARIKMYKFSRVVFCSFIFLLFPLSWCCYCCCSIYSCHYYAHYYSELLGKLLGPT